MNLTPLIRLKVMVSKKKLEGGGQELFPVDSCLNREITSERDDFDEISIAAKMEEFSNDSHMSQMFYTFRKIGLWYIGRG